MPKTGTESASEGETTAASKEEHEPLFAPNTEKRKDACVLQSQGKQDEEPTKDDATSDKHASHRDSWFCTGNNAYTIWGNVIPFLTVKDKFSLHAVNRTLMDLVEDDFSRMKIIDPPASLKKFPTSLKVVVSLENKCATKLVLTDCGTSLVEDDLISIMSNKPNLLCLELDKTSCSEKMFKAISLNCPKLEQLSVDIYVMHYLKEYPLVNLQYLHVSNDGRSYVGLQELTCLIIAHRDLKTLEVDPICSAYFHELLPYTGEMFKLTKIQRFLLGRICNCAEMTPEEYLFVRNVTEEEKSTVEVCVSLCASERCFCDFQIHVVPEIDRQDIELGSSDT